MFEEETIQEQEFEDEAEFEDEDADTTDFDDDEEDDAWDDEEDEVEGEGDSEESEESDADETDDSEELFTIKYNGEEKQLTRAELIEAAQKGFNYDKVKSKLDSYEAGNIHKAMKAGADKAKMSVEDYAKYLIESSNADAQLEAEKALKEKYPTAPADMIREMAKLQTEKAGSGVKAQEQTEEQKAWAEAMHEYPGLSIDKIPDDVREAVKNGKSPLIAMKDHEIAELRKEKKKDAARAKNEDNKRRSVGSMKNHYGQKNRDPFMEAYDEE